MINALINKLTEYSNNLTNGKYLSKVCQGAEPYITDMNANKQLFEQGVNAVGVSMMDYMPYTQVTVAIKHDKGQPVDRVTLRDTGAFEKSFFIHADDKAIFIAAKDKKAKKLQKKYGAIFGLTNENKNKLIWEKIYPYLMQQLINTLKDGNK